MNLVVIAAFIAVCEAAKLDRTYLPPSSANTAGGGSGSLQTPLIRSSEPERESRFPTGSYTNTFEGVVVDAASPGTRASSDADVSGLGGPRPSYGSSNSKVGDAAFRGPVAGFRDIPSFGAASGHQNTHGRFENHAGNGFSSNGKIDTHNTDRFSSNGQEVPGQMSSHSGQFSSNVQGFERVVENKSERPQAAKDRNSNVLALSNDMNIDSYSYGFETDNGITVGENGVAVNGIQAEGGYSYQGDDGKMYKVTYTADEGGYRPQGSHLPTPPPIPEDILKSLQKNAKDEEAGIVDDGSYDAQKYNADGDYAHDNGGNIQFNGAQLSQYGKRPKSDASAIGTFNNQNNQVLAGAGSNTQNANLAFNGQSGQTNGNTGVEQFGAATNAHNFFNGQSSQMNGKPESAQFGITGSQSTFNGQSPQVNNQPDEAQTGTGLQSSHSSIGQSGYGIGNQFESNSAHNGGTGSQRIHSSQPLSERHGSLVTGQTLGQNTRNQITTSSGQTHDGYGSQTRFGSPFGQPALASAQYETQSPELNSHPNQQGSNLHYTSKLVLKPSFDQDAANFQSSQPQFGSSFKPQGSEAFSGASLNQDQDTQDYGKPSPQPFSGQNFNRPSAGRFNFIRPTLGQLQNNKLGSASGNGFNRFQQAAGQFEAKNEYLPPFSSTVNKPESSTGLTSSLDSSDFNLNGQEPGQKDQTFKIENLNGSKPGMTSASASTSSFSQSAFNLQSAKPLNAIHTQSQPTQFTQQTSQPSSLTPAQFNLNSQQSSIFPAQSPNFISKPTSVPDTELTTPLEPNEESSSQTISNISSFGSKPNNLAQAQFGFQGNSAFGQQQTSQTLSPNFPTPSSNTNSQFETASTQPDFQSSIEQKPEISNGQPQNSFDYTQQNQPSLNQGFDNSYYYKQPSKTFGATGIRPQGSRFPSSPSYQSNGVASQNEFSNQQSFQSPTKFPGSQSLAPVGPTSTTQFAQTQSYNGITQAAISRYPSASPTSSGQFSTTQNGQFGSKPSFNQQSTFGTQAQKIENQEKNTFPLQPVNGRLPTRPISQVTMKPTSSQFGNSPSENPSDSSDGSQLQQTSLTQQYQGTIYEYNKPAEVLPASSQTDSSSSQTIETGFTSESKPSFGQSVGNHLLTKPNSRPFSEISKDGFKINFQNNKPIDNAPSTIKFGQHSQSDHGSKNSQQTETQFGSQPVKPFTAPSTSNKQFSQTGQSGAQPAKPFGASLTSITGSSSFSQQNMQGLHAAQSFMPYGTANQGSQTSFGVPQPGSQTPQLSQTTQSFTSSHPSQLGNAQDSQTQFSSNIFQNKVSNQNNGYVYPGNLKPQFVERPKNQFSQNSQSGKPQSESNQFNQNTLGISQTTGFLNQQSSQFNSASKPQFGAESQDSQNIQTTFDQTVSDSPTKPFNQPLFGQSIASSQAIAPGQATASATASNSPQQHKPFSSQSKNQFGQTQKTDSQDQKGQSSQFGAQNLNFGSNTQESNSNLFGANTQGSGKVSRPLFNSACCHSSKGSTSAQSTEGPSSASFQETQAFNTQGFAGKEQFGGPKQPPRFEDQTGYHY